MQEHLLGPSNAEEEDHASHPGDWLDEQTASELSFDPGRGGSRASTPCMSEQLSLRNSLDLDASGLELVTVARPSA